MFAPETLFVVAGLKLHVSVVLVAEEASTEVDNNAALHNTPKVIFLIADSIRVNS
ncbi:hypothetical protein JAO78_013915 [Alishewanella sp. 16-MA]|uniref:Uncharacterized protein n=1 Tax=Alishewanella maricola TaxID=2795740 RepID=A0ABS8C704_9ALTE|nr:hypothetical protein [Alishewanella maricola]